MIVDLTAAFDKIADHAPEIDLQRFSGTVRIDGLHEIGSCGYLNQIGLENTRRGEQHIGYGAISMMLAQFEGHAVNIQVEVTKQSAIKRTEPIELEEWEPTANGTLRYVQGRLIGDINKELWPHIQPMVDEYFSIDHEMLGKRWPPKVRWIACYAVTGGSEGHYIHIDAIFEGKRQLIWLGKTFMGMERARLIAAKCADLLGA